MPSIIIHYNHPIEYVKMDINIPNIKIQSCIFKLQIIKIPIRNSANGVLGIEITYLYYMYHIICTIYMYHIICAKYYILKCQNMRLFEPKKAIVIVD